MSIKNNIMLSCYKATYLVSKKQEAKLSLIEELKLKFHLSVCDVCKKFEIQTNAITSILVKKGKEYATLNGEISEERKISMQELINKALKN